MKKCRLLILLLIFAAPLARGQTVPEVIPAQCAGCHGEDGISSQPGLPQLNGQLESYLIDSMVKFQKGTRPTEVPNHIPKTVDRASIELVAKHYAASKAVRPKQETDPDKVARGEIVFRNRCADCHMDNGRDADKDSPLMAGQDLAYMISQSRLFVSGKRKFGFLQDEAFKGLSDEELDAAAVFFASQEQFAPKGGKKKRR